MGHLRLAMICVAALCAAGCGSGDEPGDSGAPGTDATTTSQASSGSGGNGPGGTGAGGDVTTTVVVNEISARGGDWIELGNPGPAAADLGGFGLCDSDDLGQCNTSDALRFPQGTQLAPGAYLLVVGDQAVEAGPGPHTTCLSGGPSTCFYATWKVSASRGEKVFLISPNNQVLTELEYPIEAAADGQTWGRLPDLTGEGAVTAPTPGAANAAP
ncbi:lamin tail domain-containing protein [Sorangium sp. So ce1097]|uniref:lamin tail domain-containing protein n=1 Tax=Sorangium sp. So ce1097 TaxID=3133330 RepID=UPI003F5E5558